MDTKTSLLPVFNIARHRLQTDGKGVTTLVGAYGCPLRCRYCLNPHAWNPQTLEKCVMLTPEALYEKVKIDELYFLATGGGVTFGGGESLLHVDFIRQFRRLCGPDWTLTLETSLNVSEERFLKVLDSVNDFIVDIKDLSPSVYEAYTGMPIDKTHHKAASATLHVRQQLLLRPIPGNPGRRLHGNGRKDAWRHRGAARHGLSFASGGI